MILPPRLHSFHVQTLPVADRPHSSSWSVPSVNRSPRMCRCGAHLVDPFLFVADDCCDVDGEHECDNDEGGEVVVFHLFASIRWSAALMRCVYWVARCSVRASLLAHQMARFQSPMAARNLPWSRMTQEWFSRRMVRFTGAPW